jgi:signal transduction histidine kinase
VIKAGGQGEQMIARAVDIIERNAKLQARLIEDLLDVSRIVAGKLRLEVRPLDLSGVIGAAVDVVRPAADAKDLAIETAIDPAGASAVRGDPDRLQQVIWNLLANAIKFTPRGGRISVCSSMRPRSRGFMFSSSTTTRPMRANC